MKAMTSFWCLLLTFNILTPCSSVSIVNFEHVITSKVILLTIAIVSKYCFKMVPPQSEAMSFLYLTYFVPLALSIPPENIRKLEVF